MWRGEVMRSMTILVYYITLSLLGNSRYQPAPPQLKCLPYPSSIASPSTSPSKHNTSARHEPAHLLCVDLCGCRAIPSHLVNSTKHNSLILLPGADWQLTFRHSIRGFHTACRFPDSQRPTRLELHSSAGTMSAAPKPKQRKVAIVGSRSVGKFSPIPTFPS